MYCFISITLLGLDPIGPLSQMSKLNESVEITSQMFRAFFFFFFSVLKETQLKLTEAKRKMFWMAHLTQKGQENHSVLGTAGNRDASTAPALSLCQLAFRLRLRVSSLRWQEPLPPMALPQRPADTLGPQSNQPPGRLSLDPFGPPLAAPIRST